MVSDGITASVCFPTLPRFGGVLFNSFRDKELAGVCVQAWNDFILEEWCAAAGHVRADADLSDLGSRRRGGGDPAHRRSWRPALCFPEETSFLGLPSFYSDFWDPVWDTVTEADIPVCMHIGSSGNGRVPTA